jgi:uncharacterized coiled-coil protein SlyX
MCEEGYGYQERRIEEVRRTIAEYEKSLQTQTTQLGCRLFADCDIARSA